MGHRYAIFSARYAPEVGGVESFTAHLARVLVSRGNGAVVVTANTADAPSEETQEDGVEVVRLPCRPLMGGRLPLSVRNRAHASLLRSNRLAGIDRVLVNTRFYGNSIDGLAFARERNVPAVVLDHGSAYLTLGNPVADIAIRAHEHRMTKRCLSFSPAFAGISSASTKWLETFGIQTSTVIPNAIDAPAFRGLSSKRDFRGEMDVPASCRLVVSTGRLTPEKGSQGLVGAARLAGERFRFIIAGEGPLRKELERDLPRNVFLPGNLSHPDLSALLSQADFFCLPTRSEGFCTSLLEAGAWGLTPIITHVGGVDEVMGDPPRFGAVLDDASPRAIATALERMDSAGKAGISGAFREHVEQTCSWASTVDALERAFC